MPLSTALTDFLCRENDLPICAEYLKFAPDSMRRFTLRDYRMRVVSHSDLTKTERDAKLSLNLSASIWLRTRCEMFDDENPFTRENLDGYLKELAKEYRKVRGKIVPAELVLRAVRPFTLAMRSCQAS
jgi:hypothetical protein